MHWLFLLLSLGAMALALRTASMVLMAVSLLASLGLLIAWAMGWYSAKAGSSDRRGLVDPAELQRLRQQAQVRKATQQPSANAGEPRDGT